MCVCRVDQAEDKENETEWKWKGDLLSCAGASWLCDVTCPAKELLKSNKAEDTWPDAERESNNVTVRDSNGKTVRDGERKRE